MFLISVIKTLLNAIQAQYVEGKLIVEGGNIFNLCIDIWTSVMITQIAEGQGTAIY